MKLIKEKDSREVKESIKMKNSQRSDTEKNYLIEEVKKKAFMKLLKAVKLLITA